MSANTSVAFADLTHTGVGVPANNTPLAVAYIAAYAKAHLGNAIAPHLFKYPAALSRFLSRHTPAIACFSNYMWNGRLACAYAHAIKRHRPETVVILGGPNYPVDQDEQRAYLETHSEIDFYIDGEGEMPFVALFEALADLDFDASRFKGRGTRLPGVHYLRGGEFVAPDAAMRIPDLDRALPSPYTTGLLDEFFDDKLTPMMRTRGFSVGRVQEELSYIEVRVKTATLQLADLDWGMFKEDREVARVIAETRRRGGWPRVVMTGTARNQNERIVEMSQALGEALTVGEIVLALPGDTKEKHVTSVFEMLDAGIQDLRLFQFVLLPGTEGSDRVSRKEFRYATGFRALARCFGQYDMFGHAVPVFEVQEICLGTNTMPRDDYVECRAFDLTVAIFNNGGLVKEYFRLGEAMGVKRSAILARIHDLARAAAGPLRPVYEEFRAAEDRNVFDRREDLEAFLKQPGTIDRYQRGEFGENQIYRARTTALLSLFPTIAAIARVAVTAELEKHGLLDAILEQYLDELQQVAIARKSHVTDLRRATMLTLHFDFPALQRADYLADPRRALVPNGVLSVVRHTEAQCTDLRKYLSQYGDDIEGFGQFLQRNDSHVESVLYRTVEYAEPFDPMDAALERAAEPEPIVRERPAALVASAAPIVFWASLLS
jgi:hypothetical protein